MTAINKRNSTNARPVAKAKPAKAKTNASAAKSAALADTAMGQVAAYTYAAGMQRRELVALLKTALGAMPKARAAIQDAKGREAWDRANPDYAARVMTARLQWGAGRLASRLPANALPGLSKVRETATPEQRIAAALSLMTEYGDYVAPGAASKELRNGLLGRRTDVQQKACNALRQAWSEMLAETGHGLAAKKSERNQSNASKARRAPHHNTPSDVGPDTGAEHEDAKPAKPTRETLAQTVLQQAGTLMQMCNKNARLMPQAFGEAVAAFHRAALAAMVEFEKEQALRQSLAD